MNGGEIGGDVREHTFSWTRGTRSYCVGFTKGTAACAADAVVTGSVLTTRCCDCSSVLTMCPAHCSRFGAREAQQNLASTGAKRIWVVFGVLGFAQACSAVIFCSLFFDENFLTGVSGLLFVCPIQYHSLTWASVGYAHTLVSRFHPRGDVFSSHASGTKCPKQEFYSNLKK